VPIPPGLDDVLALLASQVDEIVQLGEARRPWRVRYQGRVATLRRNDVAHFARLGFTPELLAASLSWLHRTLTDLASAGFLAPAPIRDLRGASIAAVDGAVWELLSYVPGEPMPWDGGDLRAAGRLLADLHRASTKLPAREQRPLPLPYMAAAPAHADAARIRAAISEELHQIDAATEHGVIHGDATQANVVSDHGDLHLVDFALAHRGALLFDVGSALWRNARTDPASNEYEPARAAAFVAGYASRRPLVPGDAHTIVLYMRARGAQIQHRLELRDGTDPTVVSRLLAVDRQCKMLEDAMSDAIVREN